MKIEIEYHSGIPVYKQLIGTFEAAIKSGELTPGSKLPPIRVLADQLDINPNTVVRVYRELELGGLIESKMGSGCFVLENVEKQITTREKERFMDDLWSRALAEARKFQIRERDFVSFIKKRSTA